MELVARIRSLSQAVGTDIKALIADTQWGAGSLFDVLEAKRAYWPEQKHVDPTGTWLRIGGEDVSDYMDDYVYLLNHAPQLFASSDSIYTPMTSATAPSPQVITQSSQVSTTYAAWRAFATANTYSWRTNNYTANAAGSTGSEWVLLDLGSGNAKSALELSLNIDALINAPRDFQLLGSNDGTNFEVLLDVTGEVWTVAQETKSYTLSNVTSAFRYFELICTRIQGTTATYFSMRNVSLLAPDVRVIDTTDAAGAVTYVKIGPGTPAPPDALRATVPPGAVFWFAAKNAPAGYLECNGAEVSRADYAALFAVIGAAFGPGDGETTFKLPDLRGEFIRGWDNGRGIDVTRTFGVLQGNAVQGHTHNVTGTATSAGAHAHSVNGALSAVNAAFAQFLSTSGSVNTGQVQTGSSGAHTHTVTGAAAADATARETRPRNVALLPCIKY
jgi:microcystin-dependent protein